MEYQALLGCIFLTLKVASLATLVSSFLGLGLAWFVTHSRFPGKRWLDAMCALPLVLPPTVVGYCLILLIGRRGVLGSWLAEVGITLIFSWQGAVVAATVVIFPLTYRASKAALESVEHSLEDAARTLGAGELKVFCRVSLPLAWRSIAAGVSLAFARGMGEFGATLMIAGNLPGKTQTLALAIYDSFQAGNDAKALTLVLITASLCASLLVLAESLTSRRFAARGAKNA
ncbi:MAG: molybdate ABC transporter permease subunit [Deltaproteobacteria bacterium]|jgi:molybdate transport system permease protein|nr:molybdate ABC transporter permease subunit [Deltaproteobacteria bacterium]